MQNKFIVEKFTNRDKSKVQAYELPADEPDELDRLRAYYKRQLDPSLTWLFEISYLDFERKLIYTEKYDIDGNLIGREEPWLKVGAHYSVGKKEGVRND